MHGDLTGNKCLALHFKITFISVCGQVGMHAMVRVGCRATVNSVLVPWDFRNQN